MVSVDPFLVPIPKDFLQKKDHREFFERLIRTVDQIRQRTGGATDGVSENSTREVYPWILEPPLEETVNYNFDTSEENVTYEFSTTEREWRGVTVSSNYTAVPWDWVNAKQNPIITLPKYPSDGDEVIVRNGDGKMVEVLGNGRDINDFDCLRIYRKGSSVRFKFFTDDNQWFGV